MEEARINLRLGGVVHCMKSGNTPENEQVYESFADAWLFPHKNQGNSLYVTGACS